MDKQYLGNIYGVIEESDDSPIPYCIIDFCLTQFCSSQKEI